MSDSNHLKIKKIFIVHQQPMIQKNIESLFVISFEDINIVTMVKIVFEKKFVHLLHLALVFNSQVAFIPNNRRN